MKRQPLTALALAALVEVLVIGQPSSLAAAEPRTCPKPLDACLAEKRQAFQKRGVLGFLWSEVTKGSPVPPGARFLVNAVPKGYPAHAAGLQEKDVLLAMDGKDLSALSREALEDRFAAVTVGQTVTFRILRDGEAREVRIVAAAPGKESVEAWLGEHVRRDHDAEDRQEYLRRLRSVQRQPTPPR